MADVFKMPEPLKALPRPNLPIIKPIGGVTATAQSLQEWHAAGGSVPMQYRDRPHVWHAKVKRYADGGSVGGEAYGNAPDSLDSGMVQDAQHFQAGGIAKLFKAAKPMVKAASEILPVAEREANLAKLLEPSQVKERLYHGTTDNVNVFDPKQAGKKTGNVNAGLGSFLSNDRAEANRYATQWGTKGGNVMPVYAQIKNPYEMPYEEFNNLAMGSWNRRMKDPDYDPNSVLKFNDLEGHKAAAANLRKHDEAAKLDTLNRRQELMDLGYDGVVVKIGGNKEYVAFEPNQIKSAIGNRGTYDVKDPDINKKAGGAIHMADGGASYGKYPAMKASTFKGKKEAQHRLPLDVARGVAAGALGMPGDIEGLVRMIPGLQRDQSLGDLVTGQHRETYLPTSEEIEKKLPFRGEEPINQLGAGFGSLVGGLSPAPVNLAIKGAKAAGRGALDLAKSEAAYNLAQKAMASPMMAAARPMGVVKEPGGNWLGGAGSPEAGLAELKSRTVAGETPAQRIPKHEELLKDPSLNQDQLDRVRYQLGETKKEAALDNWVDSNLTKYVKNEMGSPKDSLRLMFDKKSLEIEDAYAKDLARSDRSAQRAADEADPRRKANLERDAARIRAEAEFDRDLALKHVTHNPSLEPAESSDYIEYIRNRAGFPKEGMAKSDAAQAWEEASDSAIAQHRAGDIQDAPQKDYLAKQARAKVARLQEELDKKFLDYLSKNPYVSEPEALKQLNTLSYSTKAALLNDKELEAAVRESNLLSRSPVEMKVQMGRENPWINKVDPKSSVYEADTKDLWFDHILDVLKEDLAAGRIRPEQLNKMSMEQAVRRTSEYDLDLAKAAENARVKSAEGMTVHKEYPEGHKWVQLDKPGQFSQESNVMGHSVRGYEPPTGHPDWSVASGESGSEYYGHGGWEGIKSGKAKVYSLRDPKGMSHATVEVGPTRQDRGFVGNQRPMGQDYYTSQNQYIAGVNNNTINPKLTHAEWWRAKNGIPELPDLEPRITQIKGKGNAAPKEEYQPYIQDFVRSGKWTDVGDLRNTGLISIDPASELATKFETLGKKVPPYVTQDELTKLINWNRGQGELPEGFAHGGEVHKQFISEDYLTGLQKEGYKSGGLAAIKSKSYERS